MDEFKNFKLVSKFKTRKTLNGNRIIIACDTSLFQRNKQKNGSTGHDVGSDIYFRQNTNTCHVMFVHDS